jgi:formate-dependent nitrite reductase membrane component NrfD
MALFSFFSFKGIPSTGAAPQTEVENRRNRRGRQPKNEFTSYFGRPVVKKAHWTWHIWVYFWLGGIAGGASAIATLAAMFGGRQRNYPIIQAARYISLVGLVISPVLLVLDLGRPERFHHMLRIFKWRSPLNVGTYILTITGLMGGINTARQVVEDGFIPETSLPGKLATLAASPVTEGLQGLFGLGLGSYTGVVLSATATPLWAQASATMGPIFLCTSFSNGAAAISLLNAVRGEDDPAAHVRLERVEQIANLTEITLTAITTYRLTPEVRQAFLENPKGRAALWGVMLGQVIPLLLRFSGLARSGGRTARILSAALVLLGGFLLRFGIIEGGKATSQSAQAYHSITRGYARPNQPDFEAQER